MGFLPDNSDLEKFGLFLEERRDGVIVAANEESAFGSIEFCYNAIDPLIDALKKTQERQRAKRW